MKKFICFIMIIAVILSLCGCASSKPLSSKTEQYIVASLGFEREKGNLKLFAEAVVVGTEGTSKAEPRVIEGEGKSIDVAFLDIYKKISQPLLLSHCAVIVLGSSLSAKDYGIIFDYCLKKEEITLSSFAVLTESAKKLLEMSPVSSVAVGYDIVGMIEQQDENFKNRIYEIESAKRKDKASLLPLFKVQGEEFYYESAVYYKNGSLTEIKGEKK